MNEDNSTNAALRNVRQPIADLPTDQHMTQPSAVSWGAIFAGAAGAAALSLILLILGTGLGLSSVSPYSGRGAGAAAFGVSTILWLTFTQLAASGMGGYLAGRLRTRWAAVHSDEVYFRDTAHGFLSWAVASVVTAGFLTSAVGSIVGETAKVGATTAATTAAVAAPMAGAALNSGDSANPMGYFTDSLFRRGTAAAGSAPPGDSSNQQVETTPRASGTQESAVGREDSSGNRGAPSEVARIFAHGAQSGSLTSEDTQYVGRLVAQRTGMSPTEAEAKVGSTFGQMQAQAKAAETAARDAADKARRAASYAALWLFVALLAGAFVASLAATYGGRRRDL